MIQLTYQCLLRAASCTQKSLSHYVKTQNKKWMRADEESKTKTTSWGKEKGVIINSRLSQVDRFRLVQSTVSQLVHTREPTHKDTQTSWSVKSKLLSADEQTLRLWSVSVWCRRDLSKIEAVYDKWMQKYYSVRTDQVVQYVGVLASMLYNLGMWYINYSCLTAFKHFTTHCFFTANMTWKMSLQCWYLLTSLVSLCAKHVNKMHSHVCLYLFSSITLISI